MSSGLLAATLLQTCMIFLFVFVLTPFRLSVRKSLLLLGGITLVLCTAVGLLVARFGMLFLYDYGFWVVGVPAFAAIYLLSSAKGFRFVFVMLTTLLFHQMLCTLLMTFRVYDGGYTALYFFLNLLSFGALACVGWRMRADFHKIVLTFRSEFSSLCPILLLLYGLLRLFSPVLGQDGIDYDLLLLTALLDLLVVLLYSYIAVSFHSLSKRCDAERDAVSLGHRIEEAQEHIALLRSFQEAAAVQRHDLRHHLALIGNLLDEGELEKLRGYVTEVKNDLERITPPRYCQNEAANLLLISFAGKAQAVGVILRADAQLPHSLPVGNAELCALLSNALENAIAGAARAMTAHEKEVRLTAEMSGGKRLILVENPCAGMVHMENGLPQSTRHGHGFGVKSIAAIVEKYSGLYSFEAENGIFTLRIAI